MIPMPCFHCGRCMEVEDRCRGCGLVQYCSENCYKKGWKENDNHKEVCKKLQEGKSLCLHCRRETSRKCNKCNQLPMCCNACEEACPHTQVCDYLRPKWSCYLCGKIDSNMDRCAGCQLIRYCSKKCYKHSWKRRQIDGHREICLKLQEGRDLCIVCRTKTNRFCSGCNELPMCSQKCEEDFPHEQMCKYISSLQRLSKQRADQAKALPSSEDEVEEQSEEIIDIPSVKEPVVSIHWNAVFVGILAVMIMAANFWEAWEDGQKMKWLREGSEMFSETIISEAKYQAGAYLKEHDLYVESEGVVQKIRRVINDMEKRRKRQWVHNDWENNELATFLNVRGTTLLIIISQEDIRFVCEAYSPYGRKPNETYKIKDLDLPTFRGQWRCENSNLILTFSVKRKKQKHHQ